MQSTFTAPGAHLRVDGLSVSFPDRRVLTDISFVVSPGDRVGLIGENGSGKSTLLRALAGVLEPDSGTVSLNAAADTKALIGLLTQEPPFVPSDTLHDALERAVAPARRAVERMSALAQEVASNPRDEGVAAQYAASLERVEQLDAWTVDSRIGAMLAGLSLGDLPRDRPTAHLSGGQRARLSLACLLLSAPDLLLLDEPTNHLDDSAADFLAGVLSTWRGPVLMASHDRAFLDQAATSLIDLDPNPVPLSVSAPLTDDGPGSGIGVTRFTGSYTDYLLVRADAMRRWEQQHRDEQAELKRLRQQVKQQHTVGHPGRQARTEGGMAQKFYADRNAKVVSRRVNDARGRLEELQESQVRKPPAELWFRGLTAAGQPRTAHAASPVLTASQVAFEGRLPHTSLSVSGVEKWLITGANGCGKSTLLRLLAGQLVPSSGTVSTAPGLRVALLAQESLLFGGYGDLAAGDGTQARTDLPAGFPAGEGTAVRGSDRAQENSAAGWGGSTAGVPGRQVPSDATVLQVYEGMVGEQRAAQVPLGAFGLISGRDFNRPASALSVGQQRRLELAALLADPPDVLLLDEPTNHFSLSLVTALEQALAEYPGTVIVASHDRWLRRSWHGRHLELDQPPSRA